MSKKIFIFLLFITLMGAGPCDVMELDEEKPEDEVSDTDSSKDKTSCNDFDIACNHTLDISVMLANNEEYLSGIYTFTVIPPDKTEYSIDCNLSSIESGLECESGNINELSAQVTTDPTIINFHIAGAPQTANVKIFYNDYEIANKYIDPEYELSYPNGEECEPVCYNGVHQIAVSLL